ncbi:response regulator transcription factor [Nostoc flagelliforme FACHB-838]|uniref:Response regulator transcription factor n=1 Tax=Nostoc flagelliforme FACHB-838 TaxID=2692904 RepID=A0ABR8DZJ7_9NOSO|nr:response regulator transcription factor [Nostoc flagelliforme]MBD2534365.1 response regulator transcription factor [Nostoc flagelliforme FACHB-838]
MYIKEFRNSFTKIKIGRRYRVLIAEAEELTCRMLNVALSEEGYEVITFANGQSIIECLTSEEPNLGESSFDLVILDLMLPDLNGLEVCRLLRKQGNLIPILMLSAKDSETDCVLGLEVGADDYLTKPFGMRELVARCRALLRRQWLMKLSPIQVLVYKDITLIPQECRVVLRGQEVNLAPKEFCLLELFISHTQRVWTRQQILNKIWGEDFFGDTKTVDVHIRWLRKKLELDPSRPEYIVTVRGFGYRFG